MSKLLNDQLISAAAAGNKNEVDSLLDRGADIHANDDKALHWAAGRGHTATVELLLDRGADIHAKDDEALRWAPANGHTAIVALLLKRGNYTPEAVTKARSRATAGGRSEIVALIDSYQAMLMLSEPRGPSSASHPSNHAALPLTSAPVGRGARL